MLGRRILASYLPELEHMLVSPWRFLVDLDLAIAELMSRWFDIKRPIFRSSDARHRG